MRLIHLTDPHLTSLDGWLPGPRAGKRWLSWASWQTGRRHKHVPGRLRRLTDQLRSLKPHVWAVTGDLCQIGLDREIEQARQWLGALADAERVVLVPGNHDIFAEGSEATIRRVWLDYLHLGDAQGSWPVVREFGDVTLIGLNSAVVTPAFRASGQLGPESRARLGELLDRTRDRFRVVLIHHPPIPGLSRRRKALSDDAELRRILTAHGADLVLHGHLHHNHEACLDAQTDKPIRIFCTASASAAGQAGAASARVFDIEPDTRAGFRCRMRLIALDASHRAHEIQRLEWSTS